MKVIKIVLFVLSVIVLVLLVAVVVIVKTFDVNRYKPQIISQAKSVLNRDVDFEKARLDISWTLSVSLKLDNLVVAEDWSFGKGDFLKVREVTVSLDIPALLLRKQLLIPAVYIAGPQLTIIRNKDGSVNAATLVKQPAPGGDVPAGDGAGVVLPPVSVASFTISGGNILYLDNSFESPLALEIADLELNAFKISLDGPFPFTAQARVLSERKNVRLQGNAAFDLATGDVIISGVEGKTDLSELDMKKISALLPAGQGAALPAVLKGTLDIALAKMVAGAKGLVMLDLSLSLNDGEVQFKELSSPVKYASAVVRITESDVLIKSFSAMAGDGKITVSGKIDGYLTRQAFDINADIQYVKLQQLFAQDKMPVKSEGIVSGQAKIQGKGLDPKFLLPGLSGDVNISVQQAKLKDINILRAAVEKIAVLPQLSATLISGLPDKYKQRFEQTDTQFSKIDLPVKLSGGRAVIGNMLVSGEDFTLTGRTEAGVDGSFLFEGELIVSLDLSALMVKAVKEMAYLLNNDKQLLLPLKISGKAGEETKVEVDAGYIADKLLVNGIGTQLINAVDKALNKSGSPSGQEAAVSSQDSADSKKRSVADMVNGVIGSLIQNK
ncbi:MAG: AsmA family protein [Candidatus Omnitrophota bacterium]|jgi:uncharacterized protein involved in outer membrane biogenesis